ncbi:hypothetical protein QC763_0018740 [Podospora pseudopauciseta]|uniref:Uncharacterized protein n=2 Tax=Podospora TaxID=5144 RepID=A0ABR0I1Q7_9PEZI|nr:hypothetical protein QC763_0018740 [Podospora pseudopauciseta]KAK4682391.1 hypothetical protein QC764_0018680 [Podospora pseudoanserina]
MAGKQEENRATVSGGWKQLSGGTLLVQCRGPVPPTTSGQLKRGSHHQPPLFFGAWPLLGGNGNATQPKNTRPRV